MTRLEFENKLVAKFPEFLKNGADELKDIGDYLDRVASDDLEKVWDEFRMTYSFSSLPRLAVFVKATKEAGVKFKGGPAVAYEFVCYICTSRGQTYRYPLDAPKCPQCGNQARPYFAAVRAGSFVTSERAQGVLDRYPMGPHPTLARAKTGSTSLTRVMESLAGGGDTLTRAVSAATAKGGNFEQKPLF